MVCNSENGDSLQKLPDKSQISGNSVAEVRQKQAQSRVNLDIILLGNVRHRI